jgi:hypothetical protein
MALDPVHAVPEGLQVLFRGFPVFLAKHGLDQVGDGLGVQAQQAGQTTQGGHVVQNPVPGQVLKGDGQDPVPALGSQLLAGQDPMLRREIFLVQLDGLRSEGRQDVDVL